MYIENLALQNYRNYARAEITFSDGINILYGDNAQGKTNILEAIYLIGTTKSHRGSKDREIIRFDADESHIRAEIKKNGMHRRIDMHLKKSKSKGIAIDMVPIRRSSELLGTMNMVFFSPEDLSIIKNSPAERRNFMDMELCQLDKIYVSLLANYKKVLDQRNNLLRQIGFDKSKIDMLPVWDEQMVNYGVRVMERRRSFLKELGEIISGIHRSLTGGKEEIRVVYEPDTEPEQFAAALLESRERDKKNRVSMRGPHRDDIVFLVNGIDIRKYGSQGQQRSAHGLLIGVDGADGDLVQVGNHQGKGLLALAVVGTHLQQDGLVIFVPLGLGGLLSVDSGLFHLLHGFCPGKGGQAQQHGKAEQQRYQFFHKIVSFSNFLYLGYHTTTPPRNQSKTYIPKKASRPSPQSYSMPHSSASFRTKMQ